MAIYNAYLEGADREAAILDMELNNQYDKLSMLFEMSLMELDQVKRDIELKVFKESGTYDDLEYLISEAEAQVAQDQTNIISQILQWFANAIQTLFTNIKNFFTGAKNIPDDTEVQVEMNDGEDGMFGEITKILDNVANMDGKITLDNVLKVALSGVAGGGAILAIIDKINKDHPIKTKIVKWAVVKKWNQTTNSLIGKIQSITQSITQKFGDNTVIKSIEAISNCDLLIIGGTSLNVYPAAGFINYFRGSHLVLINRDSTSYDSMCDLVIHDSIGKVFEQIKKEI
jgi:hypothetical protein